VPTSGVFFARGSGFLGMSWSNLPVVSVNHALRWWHLEHHHVLARKAMRLVTPYWIVRSICLHVKAQNWQLESLAPPVMVLPYVDSTIRFYG
jgi:hypothetical protein